MSEEIFQLSKVEDAVKDIKEGKFVIVVDDEDRENEGDLIIAAEKITPEDVNFMLVHARGVLCVPITKSRCKELDLPHQVVNNTSMLGTPFTVTVDKLEGCTTGVSAHDNWKVVPLVSLPMTEQQQSGHWQTLRLRQRRLAVQAILIRYMRRTMACCVGVVIPRPVLISAGWQVCIPLVH